MELRTKASRSDAVTEREQENRLVAYRAACEGVVLLKNDGALPLTTKTVALYGPGASMTIKPADRGTFPARRRPPSCPTPWRR